MGLQFRSLVVGVVVGAALYYAYLMYANKSRIKRS